MFDILTIWNIHMFIGSSWIGNTYLLINKYTSKRYTHGNLSNKVRDIHTQLAVTLWNKLKINSNKN